VCKTASFFAAYLKIEPPEEQTGAAEGPDWGVKDEVDESGMIRGRREIEAIL
jgi:hypothetical protein